MTSLQISRRWREQHIRLHVPTEDVKVHIETGEITIMRFALLGSQMMVALSSGAVLLMDDWRTQAGALLLCFIGGTFGLAVFKCIYGQAVGGESADGTPKDPIKVTARQVTAAVPLAGLCGPTIADVVGKYGGFAVSMNFLLFVGFLIGFAGPWVLQHYGQKLADWGMKLGLKKLGIETTPDK